jgi:hypothetical protein
MLARLLRCVMACLERGAGRRRVGRHRVGRRRAEQIRQAHPCEVCYTISRQRSVLFISMMELGNQSSFCCQLSLPFTLSLGRLSLQPLVLLYPTCSSLVLECCHASLLWPGRRLLLAASWPTSPTCRHPLRHLRPHLPSQLVLLSLLLLHRHMALPSLSSELRARCKMVTVASST